MAPQKYPLDRSAAFTALLELDPEGFGKQDAEASSRAITEFLEDWYAADSTSMWDYAGSGWSAAGRPLSALQMPPGRRHPSSGSTTPA